MESISHDVFWFAKGIRNNTSSITVAEFAEKLRHGYPNLSEKQIQNAYELTGKLS